MEFYVRLSALGSAANSCFNSQRDGILLCFIHLVTGCMQVSIPNGMEFYFLQKIVRNTIFVGFNSQRDGILRYEIAISIDPREFQFPTGWNSTKRRDQRVSNLDVSIPNGMEFYQKTYITSQYDKGFNSQRDGILRAFRMYDNTMKKSFNSQRDEILP